MKTNLFKNRQRTGHLSVDDWWQMIKRRTVSGAHELPRSLFVRHSHTVDIAAVMTVLLFATMLTIYLLYLTPNNIQTTNIVQTELSSSTLDRLELWLEERNNELNRQIIIPNPSIFN